MINLEKNDESEAGQVQAKLMCKMLWNGRHKSVWCEQKSHILKIRPQKYFGWQQSITKENIFNAYNKQKHHQLIGFQAKNVNVTHTNLHACFCLCKICHEI